MSIYGSIIPGATRIARIPELSREVNGRLKWLDHYNRCHNVTLTCRHFNISWQTFYRWRRCYNPKNLKTLEDRSHRPLHLRQPTALRLKTMRLPSFITGTISLSRLAKL